MANPCAESVRSSSQVCSCGSSFWSGGFSCCFARCLTCVCSAGAAQRTLARRGANPCWAGDCRLGLLERGAAPAGSPCRPRPKKYGVRTKCNGSGDPNMVVGLGCGRFGGFLGGSPGVAQKRERSPEHSDWAEHPGVWLHGRLERRLGRRCAACCLRHIASAERMSELRPVRAPCCYAHSHHTSMCVWVARVHYCVCAHASRFLAGPMPEKGAAQKMAGVGSSRVRHRQMLPPTTRRILSCCPPNGGFPHTSLATQVADTVACRWRAA